MKAYEVDIGARIAIRGRTTTPPDSIDVQTNEELTVINLDGAYVSAKNQDNQTVYIHAWTDVELIKD
jgi:hypothetical protein